MFSIKSTSKKKQAETDVSYREQRDFSEAINK